MRSAELRFRIGRDASRLAPSLVVVDRGLAGLRWLRDNPAWPLGAAALVIALRPRRALRWATRLWWSWRAARSARAWLERRR